MININFIQLNIITNLYNKNKIYFINLNKDFSKSSIK